MFTRILKILFFVAMAVGVVIGVMHISTAFAHYTKAGWQYDPECYSNDDCFQLPEGAVGKDDGHYVFTWKGIAYRVPTNWKKLKLSQDRFFHPCISKHNHRILCFYVPGVG